MPIDWQSRVASMRPINREGKDYVRGPYEISRSGERVNNAARMRQHRKRGRENRERFVAVLDFETDPFDNGSEERIEPFLGILWSDVYGFRPIIIWQENLDDFISELLDELDRLEPAFTIYAHNGGKFDYMFLLNKLRGSVLFKGRSLMKAKLGKHELRDSLHIIPERLASWKKDEFDYFKLRSDTRATYRDEITTYCLNDCKYAMQIVRKFIVDNGLRLTIGQASFARLKGTCDVARIGEHLDGQLRGICTDYTKREMYGRSVIGGYYFGGRVECIGGRGYFAGDYKYFDVNSMYPFVMATCQHPVGSQYDFRKGQPSDRTAFVHLRCNNHGAFVTRERDGSITGNLDHGEFYTTIHEYKMALECKLISDVEILDCVDCDKFADFSSFILPVYEQRQETKRQLKLLAERGIVSGSEHDRLKLENIMLKYYLNTTYGKFAQNPRKFRDRYITNAGEVPPYDEDWEEVFTSGQHRYTIWERGKEQWNEREGRYERQDKDRLRFYNIGTGASITGAARAVLMRALYYAIDPIYCDTDSIICRDLALAGEIDVAKLGAWKLEDEFKEVIVVGKKQYGARTKTGQVIVKNKGVDGVTWHDLERMLANEIVSITMKAPTLTIVPRRDKKNPDLFVDQYYETRHIRATAPMEPSLIARRA